MKKTLIVFFLIILTLFLTSNVFAAVPGPAETLRNVWNGILNIAKLDYFKDVRTLEAFFRLAIWIVIFTLFYEVLSRLNILSTRGRAAIVAFVLAAVTAIGIPGKILFVWSQTYAIAVMLVILGVIIVGGLYLVYYVIPGNNRLEIGTRIILLLLLWYLTSVITSNFEDWISRLGEGSLTYAVAFLLPTRLFKIK